jgi:hypothetical protein
VGHKKSFGFFSCQLAAFSYQLSVISYQLSVISYQLLCKETHLMMVRLWVNQAWEHKPSGAAFQYF